MSYVYGYVGGSGVISGGMTGGADMNETEEMRKYAEAHGCSELKDGVMGVRPLPAVRDEHGEIKERTVKELLGKINEELDELKEETLKTQWLNMQPQPLGKKYGFDLAEEAADTITAITTLLEALGIDAEMRDEAQRRVNAKNRERGRL